MKASILLFVALGASALGCAGDVGSVQSSVREDGGRAGDGTNPAGDRQPDAGPDDLAGACDALVISARPTPPNVLIVLDRSGSMSSGGTWDQGTNRWTPSVQAVQTVTARLTGSVAFGLMTFPARSPHVVGTPAYQCVPGQLDVPVELGSAPRIAQALLSLAPENGLTPTRATLEEARRVLTAPCADCPERNQYVLLVTDGQPTCGLSQNLTTPADIAETSQAIDRLRSDGIRTYVVGYDTADDPEMASAMNQFARHGGTERHYPVEDEQTLLAELSRVAGALVPCEYQLSADIEDPAYVRVSIDGQQYRLEDGAWRIEGRTIILQSACEVLRDARVHDLRIVRECEPVSVI